TSHDLIIYGIMETMLLLGLLYVYLIGYVVHTMNSIGFEDFHFSPSIGASGGILTHTIHKLGVPQMFRFENYWLHLPDFKTRGQIKWDTLGDAGTKFFFML
ncbi:hypothetical protein ACJX0J_040395, partial [Zea mays]